MSDSPSPHEDPSEFEDIVEFWSERILKPGRFSDSLLTAAFTIYQNHLLPPELHRDPSSARVPRRDLISAIVGCKAKLNVHQHTNRLDFDKYRQDLSLEFAQFETTCKELAKPGDELRGLAHDAHTGHLVVIRADAVCTLRNLSVAEILSHAVGTGTDTAFEDIRRGGMIGGSLYAEFAQEEVRRQVLQWTRAACHLRFAVAESLSDVTLGLVEEVMADPHFAVENRLWAFYDKYISDDALVPAELEHVASSLALVNDLALMVRAMLDILSTDICQDDTVSALDPVTSVCADTVTVAVSEAVAARWTLLRDSALLAAWLYSTDKRSIDAETRSSIENFWGEGLRAFKGITLLKQLSTTEISPSYTLQQSPEDQVAGSMQIMNLNDSTELRHNLPPRATGLRYLIEDTLDSSGVGLNFSSFPAPMAFSLVAASILTQINFSDGYSGMAIRVVARLLSLGAVVEASRFARYLPNSPVGGYLWGHLLLQKGNWRKATVWFDRVAPILAKSARVDDYEYARIVLRRGSEDGVGRGLFTFYYHVAKLFEEVHAQSETIYFCRQALRVAPEVPFTRDDTGRAKNTQGSVEVKDTLLMMTFNNAIDIADYDEAYMALTQLTNYEVYVHPALAQLIQVNKRHWEY